MPSCAPDGPGDREEGRREHTRTGVGGWDHPELEYLTRGTARRRMAGDPRNVVGDRRAFRSTYHRSARPGPAVLPPRNCHTSAPHRVTKWSIHVLIRLPPGAHTRPGEDGTEPHDRDRTPEEERKTPPSSGPDAPRSAVFPSHHLGPEQNNPPQRVFVARHGAWSPSLPLIPGCGTTVLCSGE